VPGTGFRIGAHAGRQICKIFEKAYIGNIIRHENLCPKSKLCGRKNRGQPSMMGTLLGAPRDEKLNGKNR